jgi:hypothetical protein
VKPHSDNAGWHLQRPPAGVAQNTRDVNATGLWHGSVQIGNETWPARQGDLFDVAVTVAGTAQAEVLLGRDLVIEAEPLGSPSARATRVMVHLLQ